MQYASIDDLRARYTEHFVHSMACNDTDGVDDTRIANALTDASALVDGYLGHYRLPLLSKPALLTRYAADVASYWLSENGASVTDEKRQRYEDVIKSLEQLASGKTVLTGVNNIGVDGSNDADEIIVESRPAMFSRAQGGGL